MIKVSAIAKERLKALGAVLNKTVAATTISKVSAGVFKASTALSLTTGLFFNWIFRTFQDVTTLNDQHKIHSVKSTSSAYYTEDHHTLTLRKSFQEYTVTSDSISLLTQYVRNFENSGGVSDSLVFNLGYGRLFENLSNVTDDAVSQTTKVTKDYGRLSDNLTKSLQYKRSFTSAASFTDDVNGTALDDDQNILFFKVLNNFSFTTDNSRYSYFKNLTNNSSTEDILGIYYSKSLFNSFSLQDAPTITIDYWRNFNSSSQILDAPKFDTLKSLQDQSPIIDDLQRSVAYSRQKSDTATVSELFSKSINYSRIPSDGLNFTDAQTVTYLKNITDVVTLVDQAEYIKSLGVDSQDSVSFTDDVNGAALDDDQNILFFKVSTESLTTEDFFNRTVNYFKNFSDAYSVQESLKLSNEKSVFDYNLVLDSFSVINTKAVSDSTSLSDVVSTSYLKQIQDFAVSTDTHSLNISKILSNNFTVSEQQYFSTNYYRGFTDQGVISEQNHLTTSKNLIDYYSTLDSIFYNVTYNRNFTSAGGAYDLNSISYSKFTQEISAVFESANLHSTKTINDVVKLTDDVNGLALDDDQNILFFKVLSNSSNIVESVQFFSVKQTEDFSTVSDGFSLLNQNFIDPSYLAEDYVGESRTIT